MRLKFLILLTATCLTQSSKAGGEPSLGYMPNFPMSESRKGLTNQSIPSTVFLSQGDLSLLAPDRILYRGTSLKLAVEFIESHRVPPSKTNVMGWGLYFLPSHYGVKAYSLSNQAQGQVGVVLPVKINENAKILNWIDARNVPYFKDLLRKNGDAVYRPIKTFEELAGAGVDIVINNSEWIVLNPGSIDPPASVSEWINFYRSKASNSSDPQRDGYFSEQKKLEEIFKSEGGCLKSVLRSLVTAP